MNAGRVNPLRADIESHFKYLVEDPLMMVFGRLNEVQKVRSDAREADESRFCEGIDESEDIHKQAAIQGTVVVLDALDECGSESSHYGQRRIFLDTITKWSRLHPRFKLLITSRVQGIPLSFRNICHHIALETGDLVSLEASHDIQSFFEQILHPRIHPYHPCGQERR
jgi:hypothetical protein